ncbi:MAG TPA: hypothetical protein VFW87_27420 [Pirellulales bacterium]|nr:hypothetical protein [Pirellulales bacterium]
MRATVFAAFAAMFLLAQQAAGQQPAYVEAKPVDREHLLIEGAKAFTAEQISQVLWTDLDVAYAGQTPWAPGEQQRLLVQKTIAGYHHAGFHHVQASLDIDGRQTVLTIDEGPRSMAGAVRVEGANAVDAERLIEELKPLPPEATGAGLRWPTGEPAWFDQPSETWLAERVAALLAEQAYYRPHFFLTVVENPENNTADLLIRVDDEGQPSTINDLVIAGTQQSSREQILEYLAVPSDSPLTGELRSQILKKLCGSGRFVRCEWMLNELAERVDGWQPQLWVEEYQDAPSLAEPLSREETALLKYSEWVAGFGASDDEALLSCAGDGIWGALIISPKRGFLALEGEASKGQKPAAFQTALVVSEQQIGIYSMSQRRRVVAVPPPAHSKTTVEVMPVSGAPDWDGRSLLTFFTGMQIHAKRPTRRHIELSLKQTADAALSLIRKHRADCNWDGDVLIVRLRDRTLRIEGATGRLIEHVAALDEDQVCETRDFEAGGDGAIRLSFTRGEYDRRFKEIEDRTAGFENGADDHRPLSCLAEFIADEIIARRGWEDAPACQKAVPVLRKLLAKGIFKPLDNLVLAAERSANPFQIPVAGARTTKYQRFYDIQTAAHAFAPEWGLPLGEFLFGHEGWPAELWQRSVFLLTGKPISFPDPFSDDPAATSGGPMRALLEATMTRSLGPDGPSSLQARQGLARLSARSFRRDYRGLRSGSGFVRESLLDIVEALRSLDNDEIKILGEALVEMELVGPEMAERLAEILAALRSHGGEPLPATIALVLDHSWKHGLSALVDEQLQQLAPTMPVLVSYGEPETETDEADDDDPAPSTYAGAAPAYTQSADGPPAGVAAQAIASNTMYPAQVGYNVRAAEPYATAARGEYGPAQGGPPGGYGTAVYDAYGAHRLSAVASPKPVAAYAPGNGERTAADHVSTEIARLQALVRSLAYRVAELESRAPPVSDEPEDKVLEAKKPQDRETK